jgi:hypothetical protein
LPPPLPPAPQASTCIEVTPVGTVQVQVPVEVKFKTVLLPEVEEAGLHCPHPILHNERKIIDMSNSLLLRVE